MNARGNGSERSSRAASSGGKRTIRAGDMEVETTNVDKVLFPRDGYTKADLIDYYARISATMLPYMKGRPVTMVRYPDGIDGGSFFQKEASRSFPEWIKKVSIAKKEGTLEQAICEKEADLIYLANLACITPHIWLSREDRLDRPDRMIFDLDPANDDFAQVTTAALELRNALSELRMRSFPMTTGSKGIHVVVPLDRRADFDEVREFAKKIAGGLVKGAPAKYTMDFSKEKRGDRLLIDTFRNAYGQTGVAPYAVRAKDGAPVATPLFWKEVEEGRIGPRAFNIETIFHRLKEKGDPWRSIDDEPSRVP